MALAQLQSAPTWLKNLGFTSWLLVGFVLIILGVIWLLDQTSTIVMPVILAAVRARSPDPWWAGSRAIASPVSAARSSCCSGSSRSACSSSPSCSAASPPTRATSRRRRTRRSTRSRSGSTTSASTTRRAPRRTSRGRARDPHDAARRGVEGHRRPVVALFFLAFAALSTLFVLKDGPVMRAFINRHLGVPEPTAEVVTTTWRSRCAATSSP